MALSALDRKLIDKIIAGAEDVAAQGAQAMEGATSQGLATDAQGYCKLQGHLRGDFRPLTINCLRLTAAGCAFVTSAIMTNQKPKRHFFF
jgi:hypothetical protein